MLGKVDVAFGVIFSITYLFLIHDIFKNTYSKENFTLLTIFALFSVQLKIFGIYLFIPYCFYLFKLLKQNNSIYKLAKTNIATLILGALFLLKNFLVSGCFIFPLSISCIPNIAWASIERVHDFSNGVRYSFANNMAYKFSYNFNNWFDVWINHAYNYQIHVNFIATVIITYLTSRLLTKNNKENKLTRNLNIIFIVLLITMYFLTGPTFRYGFGIYLILISSLNMHRFEIKNKILENKLFIVSLTFIFSFSVLLTPRLYSYGMLLENPLGIYKITKYENEYYNEKIHLDNKKYESFNCYIEPTCIRYNFIEKSKYGYRIFTDY